MAYPSSGFFSRVFLVALSIAVFAGVGLFLHARGQAVEEHCKWWPVVSHIWNQGSDLWARTSPTISVGGIHSTGASANGPSCDSSNPPVNQSLVPPAEDPSLGFLQYYHDNDPDCPYSDANCGLNQGNVTVGKLLGYAWSPLYGKIIFNASDFPDGASCYGLSEDSDDPGDRAKDDRQPRVIVVNKGEADARYTISGCAYVPTLDEWILLSRWGPDGVELTDSDIPAATEWKGLNVTAATVNLTSDGDVLIYAPYLTMFNCAWSINGGMWSFGPNEDNVACLPTSHSRDDSSTNTDGSAYIRFFEEMPGDVTLNPTSSSARIGQKITYNVQCPQGYKDVTIIITEESDGVPDDRVHKPYDLTYEQVFSSNITNVSVRCVDVAGIFSGEKTLTGPVAGIYVDVFFVPIFTVTPSIIVEGGFVTFGGVVSNWGNADNHATCAIYDRTPGRQGRKVLEFSATALNNRVEGNDVVVRDTTYELACRYLTDSAIQFVRDNPATDVSALADSNWHTTAPVRSIVKVFPSRINERNVVTNDVCVPDLTGVKVGDTDEEITVSLSSGTTCESSPDVISEIRVYALEQSDNAVHKPYSHVKDDNLILSARSERGSGVDCAAPKSDREAVLQRIRRGMKDQFIKNCGLSAFGSASFARSSLDERDDNAFTGKVFVAETVTNDGRRSEKVIFKPE